MNTGLSASHELLCVLVIVAMQNTLGSAPAVGRFRAHHGVFGTLSATTLHVSNLVSNGPSTPIGASDLSTGTYRIQSGGTYSLTEDICFGGPGFNDTSRAAEKARVGWIAAIQVETDKGVVIDGNGFTLTIDRAWMTANQRLGMMSGITLANGFGPASFGPGSLLCSGGAAYAVASNVVIRNLTIVGADYACINGGFDSRNVIIHDCSFGDFASSAITTYKATGWSVRDCSCSGGTTSRINGPEMWRAAWAQVVLTQMAAAPLNIAGAAAQLALVNGLVLFLASGVAAGGPGEPAMASTFNGAAVQVFGDSSCTIERVIVSGMARSMYEVVAILPTNPGVNTGVFDWDLFVRAGTLGTISRLDLYPSAVWGPNVISVAQAFIARWYPVGQLSRPAENGS